MRLRLLGQVDYLPTYEAMRAFTEARDAGTPDELWLCEHPPVYTLGLAGRPQHVLDPHGIPVVSTNRGGQVTYHGPGQVVAYPLVDLQRAGYYVKEYVYRLEEAVIRTLRHYGVTGHRVTGAPGVYVREDDPQAHARVVVPARPQGAAPPSRPCPEGGRWRPPRPGPGEGPGGSSATTPASPFPGLAKIAALGIKVSRHCTYHGVALNVAMDLQPFAWINPCGYEGLRTVDLLTIGVTTTWNEAAQVLGHELGALLAP